MPRISHILLSLLLVGGAALNGLLLQRFSAPWWLYLILVLTVLHLLVSGGGAIVPASVTLSVSWLVVVRSRVWPPTWEAFDAWHHPQTWAALCAAFWMAGLLAIAASGLLVDQFSPERRWRMRVWVSLVWAGAVLLTARL